MEPESLVSNLHWQEGSLLLAPTGEAQNDGLGTHGGQFEASLQIRRAEDLRVLEGERLLLFPLFFPALDSGHDYSCKRYMIELVK